MGRPRLERDEVQMWLDRAAGMTYQQIAEKHGMHFASAKKRIDEMRDRLTPYQARIYQTVEAFARKGDQETKINA